jgi:acetate kinase
MRADIGRGLEFLGLEMDQDRNAAAVPDAEVSLAGSPGRVLVIQAREDVMIARAARTAIG